MGSLNAVAAAVALADEPPARIVHFADLDLTRNTAAEAPALTNCYLLKTGKAMTVAKTVAAQ
jgi:hypothetical protein